MKTKFLIIGSLILILVFGFLYTQKNTLIADDKDGKKDCSSKCTEKTGTSSSNTKSECPYKNTSGASNSDDKNGYSKYEFVTDKIHCDACKSGMSETLLELKGVKEINYGATDKDSKMTNVEVYYSATDTTPEVIAASVKEKGLNGNCSNGSKCDSKKKTEKKL